MNTQMEISKTGKTLGTLSAVAYAIYGFNKGQKPSKILIMTALIGVGGVLVGNAITKFYE